MALELRWRDRQRQILAEREKDRQAYVSQVFNAQENERKRIAQELHDGTVQELLVIANRAQTLTSHYRDVIASEAVKQAEWIRDAVIRVSKDLRRLSRDLRPGILDDSGLIPALRWLASRLYEDNGISTKIVVHGEGKKVNSETEAMIFRIVQEAINNVRRHSEATEANVTLEFNPTSLRITIQDNGKGFYFRKAMKKFATEGKSGVIGMRERVKSLRGTFSISSNKKQGCVILIEIPIESV